MKKTPADLAAMKGRGEKIVMLTAYDFPTGRALRDAGVDLALVGDSLSMTVLGFPHTRHATLDMMVHHTAAVARGAGGATHVVGDMPYRTYETPEQAVASALRFREAGADSVKVEGRCEAVVAGLVAAGIPVMGHVGLTPQTAESFRMRGRTPEDARGITADAVALARLGCYAIVVEHVPADLGREITTAVAAPVIGIGAGPHCDGQVLVTNDLLGINDGPLPPFAKRYANVRAEVLRAMGEFAREVREGRFPEPGR